MVAVPVAVPVLLSPLLVMPLAVHSNVMSPGVLDDASNYV